MNRVLVKTHSKIGITSLFLSIFSIIGIIISLFALIIGGNFGINAAFTSFYIAVGSSIAAFLLGIATFFQRSTRRIFGMIGLSLSLLEILMIGISILLFINFLELLGKALGSGFGKM